MVIDQSRITKANVDNLFKAGKITQAQVDAFNKPITNPADTVTPMPNVVVTPPVLDMTNPKYKALIEKGNTPEEIAKAWEGVQKKQKIEPVVPVVPTPEEVTPKIDKKTEGTPATIQGEPDYQDISSKRQTEILSNLEGFFAANPNSFNNEAEFKKTYSVGTGKRNPLQDQWIMNWYNGKKDAIATNSANQVKLTSLTNLNDASLANISSADAVFLMNNDPTAYLRYQKAKTDKDNLDLINGTPILNKIIEEANANKGVDYEAFVKERDAILLPLGTEVAGLKTTYENMKNQYDNILADTQKQYQGETSSFVNAMAAKKQREILPQLQQAQTEYNNKANLYNQQKALIDEEYDMQIQQQEAERNDLATKLALYEAQYGSFGERAKYGTTTGTEKILTQDFGTAKAPNWKQSLDGGLTRQSIDGISGNSGGGTVSSKGKYSSATTTTPVTSELGQLISNSKGGNKLLGATTQALSDAIGGMRSVSSLNQAVINYEKKFGPIQGNLSKINPYDIDGQTIQAQIDLIRQRIGKALEGGVLRKEDEEKYKKILPTLNDTKQVALNKLSQLSIQIANDYNATLEGFARGGYDVSGFNILNGGITPQKPSTNVFTNTFNKYDKLLNGELVVPTKTTQTKKVPNIPIGGIRFGF